jgi:hypothetical protein
MKLNYQALALCVVLGALPLLGAEKKNAPSREAFKGCAWTKLSDDTVGLEAWVQKCDYGFRKIEFSFVKDSLAVKYSDGGPQPDPLVDVLPLEGDETPDAGIKRLYALRTDKAIAARCVLEPYKGYEGGPKAPEGVKRYTFVPDKKYQAELDKTSSPDEVGDPPCGDFGDAPDGIQYFEAQPASGARKVLFVRAGQDTPLFDEQTLKLTARH